MSKPPAPKATATPRQVWPGFAESQQFPASTPDWFISRGHFGETLLALVRVSPKALDQYQQLTRGAELEAGCTLVMLHKSRATGKPGPIYVMQRGESAWDYMVLEQEGGIVERGPIPRCARCHADAVADFLFGPPRDTPTATPPTPTPPAVTPPAATPPAATPPTP